MTTSRSAITCACATRTATPSTWYSTPATASTSTSPASEFLRAALPGMRHAMDGTFECQTVRQVVEWKRPARFDDVLEISVRTPRVGTTSFVLQLRHPPCRRGGRAGHQRDGLRPRRPQDLDEARDRAAHARRSRSRRRRHDRRPRGLFALNLLPVIPEFAQRISGTREHCIARDPGSRLSASCRRHACSMTRYGRDDSCAMLVPMFTGIITDIGELVERREGRFAIRCGYQAEGIAIGASIACDGACLTATDIRSVGNGCVFTVDVSNETLSRTTLGDWRPGARINLERALEGRRRAGRAYRVGPRGRRRPHRRVARRRQLAALHRRGARGVRRLPGAQGIRRAGRHLAHRQRGCAKPIWHQYRSPHLDPHHLGREKARRQGQPGGRRLCPLRGAGHGAAGRERRA